MTLKITHKHGTTAGTPPAAGDIDVGELAINAADAELYTKDTAGNVRKFQNTTTGTAANVLYTCPNGATQTVQKRLEQYISVKDFGAKGDGLNDDTAAIQNTINTLGSSGGGTAHFPSGRYLCKTITGKPKVRLVGNGYMSTRLDFSLTTGNEDGLYYPTDQSTFLHDCSIIGLDIRSAARHGININKLASGGGIGEGAIFDEIFLGGNGGDGFTTNGDSTPLHFGRISAHGNGGAGLRFNGENQTHVQVIYVAGDNNGESLVTIETINSESNYNIMGWKSERWPVGGNSANAGNPNIFLLKGSGAGVVNIGPGRYTSDDATPGNAIIKLEVNSIYLTVGAITYASSAGTDYAYGVQYSYNSAYNVSPAELRRSPLKANTVYTSPRYNNGPIDFFNSFKHQLQGDSTSPWYLRFKRKDGYSVLNTQPAVEPASEGNVLGIYSFSSATRLNTAASIRAQRGAGTWTPNVSQPTDLVFSTTLDGSVNPRTRLKIDRAGSVLTSCDEGVPSLVCSSVATSADAQSLLEVRSSAAYQSFNSGTLRFNVLSNGNGVFTGTVSAQGSVLTSDQRFKTNITDANSQLADVTALGSILRNWDWTDDAPVADKDKRFLGLIAQQAETISPGIVANITRTKQGAELTPEVVVPAVYETRTVPAVLDEEGEVIEPETTEEVLVTEEQITPATYEELDDSYKGIKNDVLVMKLLGAVAELKAELDELKNS